MVERYSTLFDDTADIPFGLGCGGTVDLLYERVATPEAAALLQALAASLAGTPSTVLTWLPHPGAPLRRAVLNASGHILFRSPTLSDTTIAHPSHEAGLYREHLAPPQRLILLGAGDDARPVASIAAQLGWTVLVADGRAQLTRPDRFPTAHHVQTLASGVGIDSLQLVPADAVVLMTHSYEQDRALLAALLASPTPPDYIGILGARHRTSLLVAESAALSAQTVETCCSRIHAPVGLDLGGDGPEAIALAIVAEIQAFTQGKLPASRRLTPADVALNLRQGGTSRYLQTECALGRAS